VRRILLFLLLLVIVLLVFFWWYSLPPQPDAFYAAPATVPTAPGTLLKQEPFTRGIPATARAWRILYTTTREGNVPAIASGFVMVSRSVPAGQRPVVAWAHGTTGIASSCAPPLLPEPFPLFAVPSIDQVIAQGWVFVATDYQGLGTAGPHPYLIGDSEARAALDAVRATRQLADVSISNRAVAWGHSQGGHAALWTGAVAPSYAPDIDLAGVAALAPATMLPALIDQAQDGVIGRVLVSYLITSYSALYPDVHFNDYVSAIKRPLARDISRRCLDRNGALLAVAESATMVGSLFSQPPTGGTLGAHLTANIPRQPIAAPVMIAQGAQDVLVTPAVQDQYVAERCAAGQVIEYRKYAGQDHVGLVSAGSALNADLAQWTADRLAGTPAPAVCQTVAR
jgi:pimeloyl-ACP methyl ester carboxylesterase